MARRSGSGGGLLLIIAAIIGYGACGGSEGVAKKDTASFPARAAATFDTEHQSAATVKAASQAPIARHAATASWDVEKPEATPATGVAALDERVPTRTSSSSSAGSSRPTRDTPPSSGSSSGKTVRVRGYYRKDGTYVAPHSRRPPRR